MEYYKLTDQTIKPLPSSWDVAKERVGELNKNLEQLAAQRKARNMQKAQQLLVQRMQSDPGFASRIGQNVGLVFPALNPQAQSSLIETMYKQSAQDARDQAKLAQTQKKPAQIPSWLGSVISKGSPTAIKTAFEVIKSSGVEIDPSVVSDLVTKRAEEEAKKGNVNWLEAPGGLGQMAVMGDKMVPFRAVRQPTPNVEQQLLDAYRRGDDAAVQQILQARQSLSMAAQPFAGVQMKEEQVGLTPDNQPIVRMKPIAMPTREELARGAATEVPYVPAQIPLPSADTFIRPTAATKPTDSLKQDWSKAKDIVQNFQQSTKLIRNVLEVTPQMESALARLQEARKTGNSAVFTAEDLKVLRAKIQDAKTGVRESELWRDDALRATFDRVETSFRKLTQGGTNALSDVDFADLTNSVNSIIGAARKHMDKSTADAESLMGRYAPGIAPEDRRKLLFLPPAAEPVTPAAPLPATPASAATDTFTGPKAVTIDEFKDAFGGGQ